MGYIQKLSGAFICFMFGRDFMGIQSNAISQAKTFSFGADSGIFIGKLMIDSGKIVWIWNKIREYIWQNLVWAFFFFLFCFVFVFCFSLAYIRKTVQMTQLRNKYFLLQIWTLRSYFKQYSHYTEMF